MTRVFFKGSPEGRADPEFQSSILCDVIEISSWLISRSTQNRLKMTSFNFRVGPCRIRLSPRLISKVKWIPLWTTLNAWVAHAKISNSFSSANSWIWGQQWYNFTSFLWPFIPIKIWRFMSQIEKIPKLSLRIFLGPRIEKRNGGTNEINEQGFSITWCIRTYVKFLWWSPERT